MRGLRLGGLRLGGLRLRWDSVSRVTARVMRSAWGTVMRSAWGTVANVV